MKNMKRVMILGAGILQIPLIKRAIAEGYETIVVSPDIDEIGHKYATHSIKSDIRDEENIYHHAKKYQIDGILTDQTDIAVRSVAFVAERMELPGIGYATACLFTDKYKMRKKCEELGISTLKYKLVRNLDEALAALYELGGNAILKPVDNQGSKGVSLIDSPEKMIERFSEAMGYSKQKEVLVEEFVVGREFVVEAIVSNYQFQTLMVGDTHYFDIPDVFAASQLIFPTSASAELRQRVVKLNEKIITGFGLSQGRTHSEFLMKGEDIILLETAARGGGTFISSDLVYISTGLNSEKFLLNSATGTVYEMPAVMHDKCVCCYVAFFLPLGEVIAVEGIDKVNALSYTYRNNLDSIFVGMKTKRPVDKTSRFFITVRADNHRQLHERAELIRNYLNGITVKCEDGCIRMPIWH